MPSKTRVPSNDTCPINNHVWIRRSVVCVGSLLELETHSIAGEAKGEVSTQPIFRYD